MPPPDWEPDWDDPDWDEPDWDEPDWELPDEEPLEEELLGGMMSSIGIGGKFSRSSGMSGGGIGGCPLISSSPFALLTSVDQPPLPRVAPMLQDTWRLPAAQRGGEIVL